MRHESELTLSPQMLFPPVPSPLVKSPPWTMKSLMILWKEDPLYPKPRGVPSYRSPFARETKFSTVLGTLDGKEGRRCELRLAQ